MMADDPRHGSDAGYQAHWRDGEDPCGPCAIARYRTRKARGLERARGVKMLFTRDEVNAVIEPWLAQGISPAAIAIAAGMLGQTGAALLVNYTGSMRRSAYYRFAAVTEDDFHDTSKVYADLTRQRIFSLMRAGHQLLDMPVNPRGPWRTRDRISIGQARAVRDFYRTNQYRRGDAPAVVQSRMANAGHLPPAAWDDPDTLAWPLGWTVPIDRPEVDVDEVLVQRILEGDWRRRCTKAEKAAVVAVWRAEGRSLAQLGRLTGWKPERYYRPGEDTPAAVAS